MSVEPAPPMILDDALVGAPLAWADWVAMPQAWRTNACRMIIEQGFGFRSAEEAREGATLVLRLAALEYAVVASFAGCSSTLLPSFRGLCVPTIARRSHALDAP